MRSSQAGYTLIEMLVSLVIVGLASAMLLSGLSTGRRVWERADVADTAGEAVSGAQMLLRQRIERSFPATRYDRTPTYSDFSGKVDQVVFLAPPRDINAPSALNRYMLSLAPSGDLLLSSVSDVASDPVHQVNSLVLLHNVQQVEIAYFGVVPPDTAPNWHAQWDSMPSLPLLVRIRVQFPPDDPRVWPDLLVKPFATVDSMCVLAVMLGKCRGRQ